MAANKVALFICPFSQNCVHWLQVRLASLVENCFNAVERIDEFCTLNEEAPLHIPGSKPDGWPGNGKVVLRLNLVAYPSKSITCKYHPTPKGN